MTRDGLAGVVLAAGAGTRLRPLTDVRPKPLCPVGDRTLLDLALHRVAPHVAGTAVNAHHRADQLVAALAGRDVHVSLEQPVALGTAGALGALRDWIDGRPVLVSNADAYYGAGDPVGELVAGWDGDRPRLLCVRTGAASDFGELHYVGTAVLPWWSVQDLAPVPSGLYEVSWRELHAAGRLDLAVTEATAVDCGTPADYLRANMLASCGAAVVEPGAVVEGEVVRSVVWAGERVGPGERLVDAVRAAGVTLQPFATGPGG
ncbi:MAG: mannose-phosphate guanylyltransferase [Actinomycetota bacterium]|nr:mannose-phosphate guanylyltransferase [Actinomycetota bacterium]